MDIPGMMAWVGKHDYHGALRQSSGHVALLLKLVFRVNNTRGSQE